MNTKNRTRKGICFVYSLVLALVFHCDALQGQSKAELEKEKITTQKEIEYTNNLLEETRKSRQTTINRVRILDKRIQLRNSLINSISKEVELIEELIEEKENMINSMEMDLTKVKKDYEKLILYAYWNRSKQSRLMFILSSENFNQAYKRMKYIQQFAKHRKEQADVIKNMQNAMVVEIQELDETRVAKEGLVLEKSSEKHNLQKERANKHHAVNELQDKEKELRKSIAEKQRIAAKLEKEIAAIIAEEARKSRSKNMYEQLTPEEKLISENFKGNKGKLPWPTERGIITGKYGKHQHPVLKQITTQNDGIDISTVEGASARALFDGVVSKVVAILGANYTVIIRHGNFLTVYQNLVDVRVTKGDVVSAKQALGRIYTEKETSSTILHIEIWREMTKQNPEDWLSRR